MGSRLSKEKTASPLQSDLVIEPGVTPTQAHVYACRFHQGVNIGGMFVLERWLTPTLFTAHQTTGHAELDAVRAAVKRVGHRGAQMMFETHWRTWMAHNDWLWLKRSGINAIRVPIGYWHLAGGKYAKGTVFEPFIRVYQNAWEIFKDVIISRSAEFNITVLVDFHALPGGANDSEHSGTSSGIAEFWNRPHLHVIAINCISWMARELRGFSHVNGLQIANESLWMVDRATQLRFWLKALRAVRRESKTLAVVLPDSWSPKAAGEEIWSAEQEAGAPLGAVIDCHVYRCFSELHQKMAPLEILETLSPEDVLPHGPIDAIFGEFSTVIAESSWELLDRTLTPERVEELLAAKAETCRQGEKDGEDNDDGEDEQNGGANSAGPLTEEETAKQVERIRKIVSLEFWRRLRDAINISGGYYFWTYKSTTSVGPHWLLPEAMEHGLISYWKPRVKAGANYEEYLIAAQSRFERLQMDRVARREKEEFGRDEVASESWRFRDGYRRAWQDAREFDKFEHSRIGRKFDWIKARTVEHVVHSGESAQLHRFSDGFQAGLRDFRRAQQTYLDGVPLDLDRDDGLLLPEDEEKEEEDKEKAVEPVAVAAANSKKNASAHEAAAEGANSAPDGAAEANRPPASSTSPPSGGDYSSPAPRMLQAPRSSESPPSSSESSSSSAPASKSAATISSSSSSSSASDVPSVNCSGARLT